MKTLLSIMTMVFILSMMPMGMVFAQDNIVTTELAYGDIQPYMGSFGPTSRFYGLKLMLEGFSESITFDSVKKAEKKLNHAHLRLAEMKGELLQNRVVNAKQVMNRYTLKMAETEQLITKVSVDASEATMQKLEQIQIKAEIHKLSLQELIIKNPDATGLQTALQNAVQNAERLENKFEVQLNKRIVSVLRTSVSPI